MKNRFSTFEDKQTGFHGVKDDVLDVVLAKGLLQDEAEEVTNMINVRCIRLAAQGILVYSGGQYKADSEEAVRNIPAGDLAKLRNWMKS